MSPRNLFRIGVAVAALGWFGWSLVPRAPPRRRARQTVRNPRRRRAAQESRACSRIAFHPCTLAPQYGAMSVEAQCGTLSVPRTGRNPMAGSRWRSPGSRPATTATSRRTRCSCSPAAPASPRATATRGRGGVRRGAQAPQRGAGRPARHRRLQPAVLRRRRRRPGRRLARGRDRVRHALRRGAFEEGRPALLHHHRCGRRPGGRAPSAGRAATGPGRHQLRHARGPAVRDAPPGDDAQHRARFTVPNTLGLGNIFARNLDDALALQFAQCTRSPACKARVGDPRAELSKLMATLRANPPRVRYRDAGSGEWREDTLTPDRIAGMVRMYAYMPVVATLLPVLIHDANHGPTRTSPRSAG